LSHSSAVSNCISCPWPLSRGGVRPGPSEDENPRTPSIFHSTRRHPSQKTEPAADRPDSPTSCKKPTPGRWTDRASCGLCESPGFVSTTRCRVKGRHAERDG
jgi:hypothetical protein